MGEKENHIQQAKQGVPVMLVAQPVEEEGINLFDLWQTVLGHKLLVASFTILITVIGLAYAIFMPPAYKAQTTLRPPSQKDLSAIQYFVEIVGDKASYTPQQVFDYYMEELKSRAVLRDYFLNHGGAKKLFPSARSEGELREAFETFYRSLQWKDNTISITGSDRNLIAVSLNDMIGKIGKQAREDMVNDLQGLLDNQKRIIKGKIDSLITASDLVQQNRISQLEEALKIATDLGIKEFRLPSIDPSTKKGSDGTVALTTDNAPLYMRGTQALRAELRAAKERKNWLLDNSALPSLKAKLELLNHLSISSNDFRLMRVDEPADPPLHPFTPKRKRIVAGCFLGGLGLGILLAFLVEVFSRNRRQRESIA